VRCLLLCCLMSIMQLGVAADSTDHDQMIRDAVTLFDQGDVAGAISLLEEVVEDDPANGFAAYELAYSHQSNGDTKACIRAAKAAIRKIRNDESQAYIAPQLSMIQASCHSQAGESRKALKTFRAALKDNPDHYGLNFNIAITLVKVGDIEEAIVHLEAAVAADPLHPSPYYVVGGLFNEQSDTVKAMLSLMMFLRHEFNTERSVTAARSIVDLAFSGVQTDSESGAMNVFFDPEPESGDEELTTLSLMLMISAAANAPDGNIKEPVSDTLAGMFARFISLAAELTPEPQSKSFTNSRLLPGIKSIDDAQVTDAFSYFVLSQAGVPGANEWLDAHGDETDELVAYLQRLNTGEDDAAAPDTPEGEPE